MSDTPPVSLDAAICSVCGGTSRANAKFCRVCGARLGTVASAPISIGPGYPPSRSSLQRRSFDRRIAFIAAAAVMGLAAAGVGLFLMFGNKLAPKVASPTQTLYVTRLLRVRSAPSSAGSSIMGELHRGDQVTGVYILAADGVTRWLKISAAGIPDRYAWANNLALEPPPALSSTVDADITATTPTPLLAAPAVGASQLAIAQQGAIVHVVGGVAGDWWEVALDGGGVGYSRANLPTLNVANPGALGPDAVWTPPAGAPALNVCAEDCLTQVMAQNGASTAAIGFSRAMAGAFGGNSAGYVDQYRHFGTVDLVRFSIPNMGMEGTEAFLFVNGPSGLVNGADYDQFKTVSLDQNPIYRRIKAAHPNVTTWPQIAYLRQETTAAGDQLFVFEMPLLDGCHACALLGSAAYAQVFDGQGRYVGITLAGVRRQAP